MATYSPSSLGIKAPSGGFQQGGWYSGRQYWGGTLSDPGVIHPSSNQQGAGKQVSREVVAQTNPANVAYIESERAKLPTSKEEVNSYLDKYQSGLFNATQAPAVRVPTMAELKKELAPSTELPSLISRKTEFEKLRIEQGVGDLEKTLSDLKAEEDELYAGFREQKFTEEGKPVPLNVISGRISEEERTYREKVDYVGRQKSRVVDELNTKYSLIKNYMDFLSLDYNDAVNRYENEFKRNVQMYEIISGKEREARSAFESDRDAARANLQMYVNLATKGNLDFSSMSEDQKMLVTKLEAQAGLPLGFMSSVKKDKDADIVFTTSNEGVTQVGIRGADGTISVQSYGTRIATGSTAKAEKKSDFAEMNQILTLMGGGDKIVSGSQWLQARSDWAQQGYDTKEFDQAFRKYTNTNWDTYAGINDLND